MRSRGEGKRGVRVASSGGGRGEEERTLKGRAGSLTGKPSVSAVSYVSSSRTWASERRMGLSGVVAQARAECQRLGLGLVSEKGGQGERGSVG